MGNIKKIIKDVKINKAITKEATMNNNIIEEAKTSKKICFIEPPIGFLRDILDPPFSLMYLAAVAEKEGWQAEIIHMNTLTDRLPYADIYAVTSLSPQWPTTLKLSERLANEFPDKWKICGGFHISAIPDDVYDSKFDAVVIGEGEIILEKILRNPDILHNISRGNNGNRKIMGEPVKDLDTIPFPARHLIDWSRYKRGITQGNKALTLAVSIITSRGCPSRCIFCGSHCVFGRRTRFRSVDNIVNEVKHVIDTIGHRGFNFNDDTLCVSRKRVFKMCEEFSKLDILWRCQTRADTVDRELLKAMADSGCKEVIIGMESGSQKILDMLRKGTTVEQNLIAMKMVKEFMQLKVGIIVGSPGETWETIEETKKVLNECPPDYWNVSTFTPFPGSDVWNTPEKFGMKILTRDLSDYQMVGKDLRGKVIVETEDMNKADIEQARDELIDMLKDMGSEHT